MGATVPDLRGLFLRGVGGNAAELGVVQGDAIRNITGKIWGGFDSHVGSQEGALYAEGSYSGIESKGADGDNMAVVLDASRVVPTANENRPVNMAVRYLIRAA